MYKEHLVLAIVDDKAAIDIGEENRPITAVQQNRKGMQEVNHSNSVVDSQWNINDFLSFVVYSLATDSLATTFPEPWFPSTQIKNLRGLMTSMFNRL